MPHAKLDVFESEIVELSAFGRAMSHPARIAILQFLAGRDEVACMEIVNAVPLSQPACSRHIGELVKVGLLGSRADGSYVYYRLERAALKQFCVAMSAALHS